MIRATVLHDPLVWSASDTQATKIVKLTIVVDEESMNDFKMLMRRGLNTWDTAPQELKDLDSMLNGLPPSHEAQIR